MISELQQEFLEEARSSPKLFRDLAKLEQYIAQSYRTRALIELIQNADDAQSSVCGIHHLDNGLVVANDGRPFTHEDVEALCRSGASNKQRGGQTIGYRGIGFKSVVNLAQTVYVFSEPFEFYFSKAITRSLLEISFDVPLIRIPHLFESRHAEQLFKSVMGLKKQYSYTTVFVFLDVEHRQLQEELQGFDSSSLLFLNHVKKVRFLMPAVEREISLARQSIPQGQVIQIDDGDRSSQWEVVNSRESPLTQVAFKRGGNAIIPAMPQESVIHSFTPTVEFAGAYVKINGDYSTDPSRKNIDFDEYSEASFAEATKIIADNVAAILSRQIEKPGYFKPFVEVQVYSRLKVLLFNALEKILGESTIRYTDNDSGPLNLLRLKPDWLNHDDYERLCTGGIFPLRKELILIYPELPAFLQALNCRLLSLEEALERVNAADVSIAGCAEIFVKLVRQSIIELGDKRLQLIKGLRIFPVDNGFRTADQVKSTEELHPEFWESVQSNTSATDINFLLRKIGVEMPAVSPAAPAVSPAAPAVSPAAPAVSPAAVVEPINVPARSAETSRPLEQPGSVRSEMALEPIAVSKESAHVVESSTPSTQPIRTKDHSDLPFQAEAAAAPERLEYAMRAVEPPGQPAGEDDSSLSGQPRELAQPTIPPQIEKWRSAEENAATYFAAHPMVAQVKSVAEENFGYDLELFLHNGRRIFIEVKSVSDYGTNIRLTNNEYTSAHQNGNDYFIAVVSGSDSFTLKLIPNPIAKLSMKKKCERWVWFCNNYSNHLLDIDQINLGR